MQFLRNILFNLFLWMVIYLLVIWEVWDIALIILAIPVGLLLFGFIVAGLFVFFSRQVQFPHIRPPNDLMEASMLLHEIIDADYDLGDDSWNQYESINIAWHQFIDSYNDIPPAENIFRAHIEQVFEIEKKYDVNYVDYDYESEPIYRGDEIKHELRTLAEKWFFEAQKSRLRKEDYPVYLKDERLEIPSPAKRIILRMLARA